MAGEDFRERQLRRWIAHVQRGTLPRRAFVQRLGALGLAAPLAGLLLADAGLAQPVPAYKPTKRGGGGALKLLLWQGPTLLNPHFGTGSKDLEGSALFYEALIRYDTDGNPVPLLAAELPTRENGGIAADGKSVVWKLKPGVTWHDGKPFGADDVVFNWRYATDPATAAITLGSYENVRAIEKLDALRVRVVFDKPSPVWTRSASVPLLPRHVFEPYQGAKSREAPANLKPVGTGPYRFAEFMPGDLVRGTLNPGYHQAHKPHFDTVEIKGGGDPTSAARAVLQTGEYDYAWNLQVEDEVLRRAETGGKGRAVFSPSGDVEMLMLNHADPWSELEGERAHPKSRHPVFADLRVRRALALLLDRKAVQEVLYGRAAVTTANLLNNPAAYNSPNTRFEFSIEKANALLDEAGWKRGADGLREKGGKKLKLLFQTSVNPVRQKVQAVFKQACGKAGIGLELKAVTAAVFFSSDVGNPDTAGKFWADMEMFANSGRTPDPGLFMLWYASWQAAGKANKWQGINRSRWANDEYDRLFRAADAELDPVKRAAMLIRMNDIAVSEVAAIPVVARLSTHGVARSLVAPLSGWDAALTSIADWYREA
jgi:peptide/nickel transport system substrate-binding protein